MWRAEDQSLLERLEDEEALQRLWRADAPEAPPLHPRAAGLIQAVRGYANGSEIVSALLRDDAQPMLAAVRPDSMSGLAGATLHCIAVYNARLAEAPGQPAEKVERARLCSLGAWVALADQASYLTELARTVLDDDEEVQHAVAAAAVAPLESLAVLAREGARELTLRGAQALRALTLVTDACRISGCSAIVSQRFEGHAERLHASAIDTALAPIREAISDATARGQAEVEGPDLMERVRQVWTWADTDEHVERFAIDAVTPIAWNVYHEDNSDSAMRGLIDPLEALVDRLARRVEADPNRIAYAAPCAQLYVFRSQACTEVKDRRRWADRSLEICPSHRNGRLILANLLMQEVRNRVDRSPPFLSAGDFDALEANLERAEKLYPRSHGLDALQRRVAELREQVWWRR